MTIVADTIAAEIAALERITTTAEDTDPGYGRDLSCVFDVDALLSEVTEDDPTGVLEAVARRLITEPGSIDDAPDYGYNLIGLLNMGVSAQDIARIESSVGAECLKDDRVSSADVSLTVDLTSLAVRIQLSTYDPTTRPPAFTFVVKPGTNIVELLA